MVWTHTQRVGEGIRIEGRGRSIDMKLLRVLGTEYHPYVMLEVEGLPGCSGLEFSAEHGYVKLVDGIRVRVHREYWNKVDMYYYAPKDYKFEKIKPPKPKNENPFFRSMKNPRGHGQLKGGSVRITGKNTDISVKLLETYPTSDPQQVLIGLTGVPGKEEMTLSRGDLAEIVDGFNLELENISPTGYKAWIYYSSQRGHKFHWKD